MKQKYESPLAEELAMVTTQMLMTSTQDGSLGEIPGEDW